MNSPTPEEVCISKIPFATPQAASQVIARARRLKDSSYNKQNKIPQSWYQCPTCEQYHLTSHGRTLDPDLSKEFSRNAS